MASLTQEILQALGRPAISVNEEMIGPYLRNPAELEDLSDVLTGPASRRQTVIGLGLFGSRLRGRFCYTWEQLFTKLWYSFGQQDVFELDDLDELNYYVTHELPPSVVNRLKELVMFLCDQQAVFAHLGTISFASLPGNLQKIALIRRNALPFAFLPRGSKLDDSLLFSHKRLFPHPAAFFPDIDIVRVLKTRDTKEYMYLPSTQKIGEKSGTCFHITDIYLGNLSDYLQGLRDAVSMIVRDLVPLHNQQVH